MSLLRRLLARRDDRPLFVALALLVIAALATYPVADWYLRSIDVAPRFGFWDFGAYSSAVDRWTAGEPLYLQNENGGYHGSYLYPPVALLAFAPFLLALPFRPAVLLWTACTVALLWVAVQRLATALGVSLRPWERLAVLPLVVGFQPVLLSMKLGQTAAALGALLTFAASASLRGRPSLSGALTAAVGVVKLPYAPAGAHLLGDRDRFVGAVLGGLALLALSLVAFGVDAHRTFLDVLAWGVREGSTARSPRVWLPPYYRPLYDVPHALLVRVLGSLAIAVGVLRAPAEAVRETTALGFAAVPLLAPLTYAYYFVAAIPAVLLLVAAELDRPDGYPALPLVGLLLLHGHSYGLRTAGRLAPEWVPGILIQPGLWGNLLLVGLAAVRVARAGGPVAVRSLASAARRRGD
ncbi:glycosyltransferase family 87 protein [Haloplanus halophilus]|uniref:glycosyltransferase family 87 protein n=1 Tax=Haloplanus halophilus TaxID=2949993 RepID=UPI00203A5E18|nr:glycosyltransferase family 87 protein [Haloplanus sp. GDY1]